MLFTIGFHTYLYVLTYNNCLTVHYCFLCYSFIVRFFFILTKLLYCVNV